MIASTGFALQFVFIVISCVDMILTIIQWHHTRLSLFSSNVEYQYLWDSFMHRYKCKTIQIRRERWCLEQSAVCQLKNFSFRLIYRQQRPTQEFSLSEMKRIQFGSINHWKKTALKIFVVNYPLLQRVRFSSKIIWKKIVSKKRDFFDDSIIQSFY